MQHLLDRTTDVVTSLMHYDVERSRVQNTCPHPIILICDNVQEGWCATCGKSTTTWQRCPHTTYIDVQISEQYAVQLQERPVAVPTLAEFIKIMRIYLQSLSAACDGQTIELLVILFEQLGVEHHFIPLSAQVERMQLVSANTPPSS